MSYKIDCQRYTGLVRAAGPRGVRGPLLCYCYNNNDISNILLVIAEARELLQFAVVHSKLFINKLHTYFC